jgi:hypothetical protein
MGRDRPKLVCTQLSSVEWGLLRGPNSAAIAKRNVATTLHHIGCSEQAEVASEGGRVVSDAVASHRVG